MKKTNPCVGVLAIQGGFAAHQRSFAQLGVTTRQIRQRSDLQGVDALVLPGGESTTMMMGLEREKLVEPISAVVQAGLPVFATCAGMILASRDYLHLADFSVQRNAFGPQVHSFELDLSIASLTGPPFPAVFIRAPRVEEVGQDVYTLATVNTKPVAVYNNQLLAVAFHPELTSDLRMHRWWLETFC